jgi:hypothetical protein
LQYDVLFDNNSFDSQLDYWSQFIPLANGAFGKVFDVVIQHLKRIMIFPIPT